MRALATELEAEFAPGMGAAATAGATDGTTAGATAGSTPGAAGGGATFTFGDAATPLLLVLGRIGRLPLWFPAVFRALVTLEGAAVAVDPSFEVMRRAMPAVAQILVVNRHSPRSSEVLRALLLDARERAVRWSRVELLLAQALVSSEDLLSVGGGQRPGGAGGAPMSWGAELASASEDVVRYVARDDSGSGSGSGSGNPTGAGSGDKAALRSSVARDAAGALEILLARAVARAAAGGGRGAASAVEEKEEEGDASARELVRVLDIVAASVWSGAASRGSERERAAYGAHLTASSARVAHLTATEANVRAMLAECGAECVSRGVRRARAAGVYK